MKLVSLFLSAVTYSSYVLTVQAGTQHTEPKPRTDIDSIAEDPWKPFCVTELPPDVVTEK